MLHALPDVFESVAVTFVVAAPFIIAWLLKSYLPGYLSEKGKNLATKDDIAEITQRIEHVKNEYAKELELHRSDIWLQQQRLVWVREEFSLKFDTYKNTVFLLSKFHALIADFQVSYASREVHGHISQLSMKSEKNKKYFRLEYENSKLKLEEAGVKLDSIKIELKEIGSALGIYFNNELPTLLTECITALDSACNFHWDRGEFKNSIQLHCISAAENDLNDLARDCIAEYLSTAARFGVSSETSIFLDKLKAHMIDVRAEIINI